MSVSEVDVLDRAHQLFAANPQAVPLEAQLGRYTRHHGRTADTNAGVAHDRYRLAGHALRDALRATANTDAAAASVIAAARADHGRARQLTKDVVAEARADAGATADNPLAQREVMRRRVARLRAQQAHVRLARQEALRHRSALRGLRYRNRRGHRNRLTGAGLQLPNDRAGIAVRAALSRLGRPYVWGAAGPNQFDCSGLTQWAYAQAGTHLDRTTYQQIHAGIAVSRADVRAGDLVFPSTGHVQMAIGNNLVVEAPHSGATVRISPLGGQIAIRRPTL